jgi:hypothetical protein
MIGVIVRLTLSQRKANRKRVGRFCHWCRFSVSARRNGWSMARSLHHGLVRESSVPRLAAARHASGEDKEWGPWQDIDERIGAIGIAPASNRWAQLDGLKSGILLLLGAWVAYFVVVELFIRTLNKIIVPVVGIPLSAVLAVQGCALLFLGALYLVARRGRRSA